MNGPMSASRLDRYVTILRPTTTRDPETGEATEGFANGPTIHAAKWPVRSSEIQSAGGTLAKAEIKFMIRHRTDIDETTRLRCDGIDYAITGIEEIGRRAGLFLYATRVR